MQSGELRQTPKKNNKLFGLLYKAKLRMKRWGRRKRRGEVIFFLYEQPEDKPGYYGYKPLRIMRLLRLGYQPLIIPTTKKSEDEARRYRRYTLGVLLNRNVEAVLEVKRMLGANPYYMMSRCMTPFGEVSLPKGWDRERGVWFKPS
jgi:hypothetical protein